MKSSIDIAVIPAAGLGTRFFPLTKAQPKEMLPVVDKPVIQYVVEEAVEAGIEDILIITGKNKRAIEDHFDPTSNFNSGSNKEIHDIENSLNELSSSASIHFIRQRSQRGLGDAIIHAKKHCKNEPFAVLLGDTITISNPGCRNSTRQMIEAYDKFQQSVIVVEEVPEHKIKDYGIIDGIPIEDSIYQIQRIVEKPAPEEAPSNLGAIGRYLFTPEIFEHLTNLTPGYGGEIQLTDGIELLERKIGLVTKCTRYDIGDKIGWMISNLELTLKDPVFGPVIERYLHDLAK